MARMTFKVELQDGTTHEVGIGDADTIATEDKYGIDATAFAGAPKTEWFAYMAWHALKRRKQTDLSWDAFKSQVEVLDPVAEESDSGNA